MLTHERLLQLLDYSPTTGVFRWKVRRPHAAVGAEAGSLRPDNYVKLCLDGKSYLAHRVAWFYVHGVWPVQKIDHRDGNKTHNRLRNLRDTTQLVNMQNQHKLHKTNRSGYRGVSLHAPGKWMASISVSGKTTYLGLFETPAAAHEAYKAAKSRLHDNELKE